MSKQSMADDTRTFVIAEAGVNHNGSFDAALRLIDAAAEAEADAVKFQTFRADAVAVAAAPKAAYQRVSTGSEQSQLEMIRALELGEEEFLALAAHATDRGIEFMSTPFDGDSAAFLAEAVGVRRMKVPSGEITNGPLVLRVAQTHLPIILSTGMSTLAEVETALGVIAFGYVSEDSEPSREKFEAAFESEGGRALLRDKVTLLHCTTEYPTPFDDVNLRAMDTMAEAFGLPVGYSDHTLGITIPVAAVARGARVIEKHFTLDRTLPGPDHAASLEPAELSEMVRQIRIVERAMGSGDKAPAPSERKNMAVARRSLVATREIQQGEMITSDAVTAKRPGDGLSPMAFWEVVGRPALRSYRRDDPIEP